MEQYHFGKCNCLLLLSRDFFGLGFVFRFWRRGDGVLCFDDTPFHENPGLFHGNLRRNPDGSPRSRPGHFQRRQKFPFEKMMQVLSSDLFQDCLVTLSQTHAKLGGMTAVPGFHAKVNPLIRTMIKKMMRRLLW